MNPEEIKVGDKVLVEAVVTKKHRDGDFECSTEYTAHDGGIDITKFDVLCSLAHKMTNTPANVTKNTEPSPKYDPNRRFREGDEVRIVQCKGRHFNADAKRMWFCTGIVTSSECEHEYIDVCVSFGNSEEDIEIDPAYLELVKPVEELEPYSVFFEGRFVHVRKGEQVIVSFNLNAHPHAKEAAEAERDRLNAEYRKEQE